MNQHYRPVDHHVVYGQLMGFRELCEAAIPGCTRFIVLDMDRTLHLARNMGEYMGWEMSAYHAYGAEHLERVEDKRDTSRFFFDWSLPLASTRYIMRGGRAWAYPGLFYLLWGRMAGALQASRKLRHRLFGAEPFSSIQAMPTLALMHELSGVAVGTAAELADRLLRRFARDQVFDRDDIDWLRARCPQARIILSSASPRPTVEAAARALGIDDWECSEVELHDDCYTSPFQLSPMFLHSGEPQRITPPSRYRVNAGRAKVQRLLSRYPELADHANEVVGITDTWHGEDHCWADHFTRVVDINSTCPFPPLVPVSSPVRAIHSAQVLTRGERERRHGAEPDYVDPRRAQFFAAPVGSDLGAAELARELAEVVAEVESLAETRHRLLAESAEERAALAAEVEALLADLEEAIGAYNDADAASRGTKLAPINQLVRAHRRVLRRRARAERAASEVALSLSRQLAAGRAAVDRARTSAR